MSLIYLKAHDFRAFETVTLEPGPKLNVIIGANGSGKTSLLEAIHVLSLGRSFRSAHTTPLIRYGEKSLQVFARYQDLTTGSTNALGIERDRHGYQVKINAQNVSRIAELARVLPVRGITPDIHYSFYQSAKHRRALIDWGLFHVEQGFYSTWLEYRRTLKQRNALLRAKNPQQGLAVWDKSLLENARLLTQMRQNYLSSWEPLFRDYSSRLLGTSDVELSLKPGWRQQSTLEQVLQQDRDRDVQDGYTHSGPHRADLAMRLAQHTARDAASQGQQKLLFIALTLAQLELFIRASGSAPLLLLDDLVAELDRERRGLLLELLWQLPIQVFATATDLEDFVLPAKGGAKLFHVEHGQLRTDAGQS